MAPQTVADPHTATYTLRNAIEELDALYQATEADPRNGNGARCGYCPGQAGCSVETPGDCDAHAGAALSTVAALTPAAERATLRALVTACAASLRAGGASPEDRPAQAVLESLSRYEVVPPAAGADS